MTTTHEKRRTSRHNIETSILCSYFNKPTSTSAKTINYSRDGMFFVSDTSFHLGSTVFIRAKNDSSHHNMPEDTEGLRQTTLAEVRWCKQISAKPTHYEVGVKYYESWY